MVKDFVFIEDGSLDQYNLLKLLENSGMTNENVIRYKQGSPKPELVSVECNTPQLTNELMLEYLKEYLDNTAEKKSESYFDNYECTFKIHYTTTIDDTIDDFITKFKAFLETKYDN